MYSYAITIGRNTPVTDPTLPQYDDVTGDRIQAPMSITQWETFKDDAAEALRVAFEKTRDTDSYGWSDGDDEMVIEAHHGKGVWKGVEEESTKVTMLTASPVTHLHWLRGELTALAREYGQDAIAFTVGESELC